MALALNNQQRLICHLWHYAWHLFLCVWVPLRESLCLFWCETNTKGLRMRSPTRLEGWRKEGLTEDSQQKVSGEDSQEMKAGQRREKNRSQKDDCEDLLTYRGRVNQHEMSALLVALWEFLLVYTLALAHRMHKKYHIDFPPSCAWSRPKSVFVHLFFSSTLSVVFLCFVCP